MSAAEREGGTAAGIGDDNEKAAAFELSQAFAWQQPGDGGGVEYRRQGGGMRPLRQMGADARQQRRQFEARHAACLFHAATRPAAVWRWGVAVAPADCVMPGLPVQ